MGDAPPGPHAPRTADSLGPVLFRKTGHRGPAITFALPVVWASVPFWMVVFEEYGTTTQGRLLAALCAGALCLLAVRILSWGFKSFRCHERGVSERSLLRTRAFADEEITAIGHDSVRRRGPGVTRLRLEFGEGRTVTAVADGEHDPDLLGLRDRLSRVLAVRLYRQIVAGSYYDWTEILRIDRDGVHVKDGRLWRDADLLLFREGLTLDSTEQQLRIVLSSTRAVEVGRSVDNFHAGLLLLLRLQLDASRDDPGKVRPLADTFDLRVSLLDFDAR